MIRRQQQLQQQQQVALQERGYVFVIEMPFIITMYHLLKLFWGLCVNYVMLILDNFPLKFLK